MAKEILCGFGIDVDAVAGWLGSYGGEDSPDDISRGLFAGEVGSPRLLKMFERLGIKTTWFIPGHSIETFPKEMKAVADAGHEIGIHGYSHENPIAMTREQETEILDKCIELVTQLSGKRPTGYVAPWWEFSPVTNELLLERGIKYDHSLMHNDHTPYYVRVGDSWTKIDYAKKPRDWMMPLKRGQETDLIEIPASWYLDDLPPMMFIKKSPNSHGFVNPRDIEEMWRDQFDWVYREYDYAVFPMTIHPDVSGRPHVLVMLERLYHHMIGHPGVKFVTMNEMADDFARQSALPREEVSRLAARIGAALCAACWAAAVDWTDAAARPGVFTRNVDLAAAPARAHQPRRLRPEGAGLLRAHPVGLAGLVLHPVDADRQDRDRRQSHAPLGRGREADRPAVRSARSAPDRAAGGGRWLTSRPVNLITGFLGSGKTTLLQRLLADPALGRHRRADQRVRRGRARSPSARAHRRDDGAAAVGLPVLHHPRRAVGGDQGPPFQARARRGAGLPPPGRRELGPGRSVSDPVDGAGRSGAAPPFSPRQRRSPPSMP